MDHPGQVGATGDVAARLRGQAARLASVADSARRASFRVTHPAEGRPELAVTASGGGTITELYVGARALGSGPEWLSGTLVTVLNQALRGARQRAVQMVEEVLLAESGPGAPQTREPGEPPAAWSAHSREVTASSPDGRVRVTASPDGTVAALRLGPTAVRGSDNVALAGQITTTVNEALAAVTPGADGSRGTDPAGDAELRDLLGVRTRGYERRMDQISGQLERTERRLDDLG
jgi:hypothetical protein